MKQLRHVLTFMLLWLATALVAHAQTLIVSSEAGGAYAQTRDALLTELERAGRNRTDVRLVLASEWASQANSEPHRLVVTLGAEALRTVLARGPTAPVIASLIPRNVQERLLRDAPTKPAYPITAVYLDQPLGRQLDLLHLALPDVRRVGVLVSPELAGAQASLQAAAASRKLHLVSAQVDDTTGLYPALRSVLEGSDILLAMPDPRIYNSASISNILLASYRARLAVQAFSPAYVKAGALLAVYSNPEQIGVQTAEVVRHFLAGGGLAAAAYPSEYQVDVNEHVARSLGLHLNADGLQERLRRLERTERQERRP